MNFTKQVNIIAVLCTAIFFISCNSTKKNHTEATFNPKIENEIANLKQSIQAESVVISSYSSNTTDTTKSLYIHIIEPKQLPKANEEVDSISYTFSLKAYELLENKNDFNDIQVEIAFNEGELCDAYRRIKFSYTFTNLAKSLAKL